MSEIGSCPQCQMENTYFDGMFNVCADCGYEWNENGDGQDQEVSDKCVDANGNELKDGDSVIVTQTLKVKGSTMVIKMGTKVKSIRLTENPTQVDCKIDGSSIVLKTCFLKK